MLDIRFAQVKAVAFVLKPSPQAELLETLKKRLGNEMGVYAGEICILDLSSFSESDQALYPLSLEPFLALFRAVGAQLCEVRTCLKWLNNEAEALGLRYEETEPPLPVETTVEGPDEASLEALGIEAFLDEANAVARQQIDKNTTKNTHEASTAAKTKGKSSIASANSLIADAPEGVNPSFWPLARKTMVVETPVRSGQKVYARGADLVVLGPVSPGAEVIADGHVLVYGHLRGRALAGANGDANAKVIATCFEPELVAIAGYYLTFEGGLGEEYRCKPTTVVLDNPKEPARVQLKTLNIR